MQAYSLISEIIYNQKRRYTSLRDDLAKQIETILPNSTQEYIQFIMQEGEDINLDQHLTISNINKDDLYDTIKNYIDNIKKTLKREYKSPNRHIFPALSQQFIADITKRAPRTKIRTPTSYKYNGGKKHHNKNNKRKKTKKRIKKRQSKRQSKKHRKRQSKKHRKRQSKRQSKKHRKR